MGIAGFEPAASSCHINSYFSICSCTLLYKFPETPVPTIMLFIFVIIVIIVPPDIMNLNKNPFLNLREYMTEQHEKTQTNNPNHDIVISKFLFLTPASYKIKVLILR